MDETAATDTDSSEALSATGRRCAECGSVNPPGAKFCAECGTRLETDPTSTVRKLVTMLFCDLVGSTALGERLDPEVFRQVQLRYYATCEAALHRHRGTIEKFIGDAVFCVFGIPTANEDDAHRACRAALDLVAGIEILNADLESEWGVRLSVRIGVNTGVVFASGFRPGQPGVTGDAVNTAARLEQAARAGEILIGAMTRELIGDLGICVPVPPLELKGKGGRVPAWRLVDIDVAADEGRTTTRDLVGRDEELRDIETWVAHANPSGMLAILGSPGIGKSRLLAEVVDRTSRDVYWGRCPPYGEEITYRLLADWFDAIGEENALRLLDADAADHLRFAIERSQIPATTDAIHEAARALLTALGAEGEVMLVAEDVHWAEPSMLELLRTLSHVPGVAILATARPEVLDTAPDLAAADPDARLALAPLPREAAEMLLGSAAGDRADSGRILADAEGNPLLILQLALHVAEGGDVDELPAGIEAVLQARVDRLSAQERAVAERGAVMGREFWDSGVAALAPDAPPPASALALLARRQFVVEGRADGAPDVASPTLSRVFSAARPYSFTHALLRDRVYESTPKLRRADLHEQLGELLVRSGAPDELVAFHLERAARLRSELQPQESERVAERAAEHLERAGERALARRDGDAARAFLTRAAELLDDGSDRRSRIDATLVGADSVDARTDLVPGDVIGGYRVRAVAGRGGMGVVYRAEDLALGRQVALKVIAADLAGDARFRERFIRESRIAAGLEHPNVVPVYGAGEESGRLFIAMRFVEGTDLQQLVRDGPLDARRAVAIVSRVAEALDAAHRRGLVHRDVKPANVLVTSISGSEQAYLTDFGLTRDAAAGDGLTKTGQWVGTLAYVAPEQIRGEPVDARADIYALGAVLYQCVTGRPPFSVASELEALAAHLDEPPPRPSKDGAPRGLDGVVDRAMAKEPGRRYRSAGDLGRAAVTAVEGGRRRLTEQSVATGAAAPTEVGRRRHRRGSRRAGLVGLGIGAVVVSLAVAVAFASGVFSSGGGSSANVAGRLDGEPIVLNHAPERLASAGGDLWAMTTDAGELARIDTETDRVDYANAPFDLGGGTFPDIAGGLGSVWQTHANRTVGGVDRIDTATMEGVERIALPAANALAIGLDAVWATTAPARGSGKLGALVRIDPEAHGVRGSPVPLGRDLPDVGVSADAVWVVDRNRNSVVRLDPRTMRVRARIPVGDDPGVVAVSPEAVWVANFGDRTLTRIDPQSNDVVGAPVSLGKELDDILAAGGGLWVASADGTVTRLEVGTGKLVGTPITVGHAPLTLGWDGGRLWVGSASDQTVQAISP